MQHWIRKAIPESRAGRHRCPLCLVTIGLLGLLALPALGGDSPFASEEEKTFLLRLAGRDGLIEEKEWNESAEGKKRAFFNELSWEQLRGFDFDRDGRLSLNEFFEHLVVARKAESVTRFGGDSGSDNRATTPRVRLRSGLQGAVPGEPSNSTTLNTDSLGLSRRAQIAKNIKRQNPGNTQEDTKVQEDLMTRRKILQGRRRYASAMESTRSATNQNNLRDLFKSRIVKDRLSRVPDIEPATRSSLSHPRLATTPEKTRSRQRAENMQQSRQQQPAERRAQVPSRAVPSNNTRARPPVRDAANIRDLIPPTPSKSRSEKLKNSSRSAK